MEQLNNVLSDNGEETNASEVELIKEEAKSPLLIKIHQNYGIFALISLIFGGAFTLLFYKAGMGLNAFLFTMVMIALLAAASKKLELPIKKATIASWFGAALLGLSNMLTASPQLWFLNTIGILLLLDLSLLLQFKDKEQWDFTRYLSKLLGLPFVCIASIGMPFFDGNRFFKKTKLLKNDKFRNVLIGGIIAIPLLLIVTALLSSADLLFGKMTSRVYDFIFSNNLYLIAMMVFIGFLACYCILCGAAGQTAGKLKVRAKADAVIGITVTTLLLFVYALFCGIQVAYLFNNGLFALPAEFTYAEYARRGFFELLAVTCFNILLILFCMNIFRENKLLRYLLSAITACTYIMIASSAYRMFLYIGEYHLTFLRLFVLMFLLIDALILAGIIVSLYRKSFPLFGYCVVVVSVCYLLFSFGKPDYYIAAYLLDQKSELEVVDIAFLTRELSYDAAPVVIPRLYGINSNIQNFNTESDDGLSSPDHVNNVIENYFNNIEQDASEHHIRDFNLSYTLAENEVDKYQKTSDR